MSHPSTKAFARVESVLLPSKENRRAGTVARTDPLEWQRAHHCDGRRASGLYTSSRFILNFSATAFEELVLVVGQHYAPPQRRPALCCGRNKLNTCLGVAAV